MTLENNYNIKSLTTPAATGGTVTTTATHRIHTFTSSGTFTVNKAMNVEALVVAGGGGGGRRLANDGGAAGGGAGGLLYNTSIDIIAQEYSITVGNGGVGATNNNTAGENGQNSVFSSFTAIGGGGGAGLGGVGGVGGPGSNGGSGGGAGQGSNNNLGGNPTVEQGYKGGDSNGINHNSASGGGGAGAVGGDTTQNNGGSGGAGLNAYSDLLIAANAGVDVSGTHWIAGGGGGAAYTGTPGAGGSGGGGTGSKYNIETGTAGIPNTGGGGGGGQIGNGFGGGSGIVIIRYPLSQDILSPANITATSMTVSPPSESPCRAGICTVVVSVTWTNNGESTGSFVPSLTFSGGTITPTYPSEPLGAGASVVHTFTISNMTAGTHSICPNPN